DDRIVFVPPAQWVYRAEPLRAKPRPAGEDAEKRELLRAKIEELERQRAPLLVKERQRQVALEVVRLRLRALRRTIEEEKPTGVEADRARERLRSLQTRERLLRAENREGQIYLRLLEQRLRVLRKAARQE